MKFATLCLTLLGTAQAFAPASQAAKSTALNEKVECFGEIAPTGFLGRGVWDSLTQAPNGSADTGAYLRAA